ncbi:MAG TPA: helicase-associated domain-containing protein [Microbacteriaceae bacterium]
MSVTELHRAMVGRGIPASGIGDFFDLAEAFLETSSVQQALTRLDRASLAVIAAVGRITDPESGNRTRVTVAEVTEHLSTYPNSGWDAKLLARRAEHAAALLLLDSDSHGLSSYSSIDELLRSWPALGLPSLEDLTAELPPAIPRGEADADSSAVDRLAAERAFTATTATAELLIQLERNPARELAKGGVCLPDTKRLAHAMAVELPRVADYLAIASRAGLVAKETGSWLITERGVAWLQQPSPQRWSDLANAWVAALPAGVRRVLGSRSHALWGDELHTYSSWFYPAGGEWMTGRIAAWARDAELLGVTAGPTASTSGALLLADDPAAVEVMSRLFPPAVDTVYLQHDLSVVAPGPLAPHIDARLRTLADVDSRTLASSYRISTSSINRALAHGESAESILEFLGQVSPTGIPQPIHYLIGEASSRYGLLRVGALERGAAGVDLGARSYLRSDLHNLLDMIRVDQNLQGLGLSRVGPDRLLSRLDSNELFWVLSDARYPVAAENAQQEIVALRRHHASRSPAVQDDAVQSLIERLKREDTTSPDDTGRAWLTRRLEIAIREKTELTVSVAMPNGTVVDYLMEPASVSSGRLRAHDRRSAIERTLPLSSIVRLSPASAS